MEYTNVISAEEYMNLRKSVGWTEFPLEQAQQGIDHTYFLVCAREGGRVVGCVRLCGASELLRRGGHGDQIHRRIGRNFP